MSKEENEMVPKLRFPEFTNGKWEMKRLENILLKGRLGGNYENSVSSNGLPVIKMGNLERGNINVEKIQYLPEESEHLEADILRKGDLLLNTRNTLELVGKVAVWKDELPKAVYNSNLLRLNFREEIVTSTYFMNYCFNTNSMIAAIREIATGTTSVAAIYTKDLLKLNLSIPSLQEQQKIADCLSSLDEYITAESQQLEAFKAHKKGLMQQLFPAEGETVPQLRFAEFRDSGEWEEKSIQELIDEKSIISHLDGNHGAFYPNSDEFSEEGIPYISANDFITGLVDFKRCKYLPEGRALMFKKGVARNGDILFAHNATVGPVAKLDTEYPFVILSTTATYFRCNNASLLNHFLKFALSSSEFVRQYTRVMSQSTRNQIPITTQRKFNLLMPNNKEQQKIADCLSSLDALITAQAEKIKSLKLHKKGLMQGLFPSPEGA